MRNQKAEEIYQEYYDGYLYVAQSNTSPERVFYRLGMLVEIWDEIRRCLNANRHKNEQEYN